MTENIEVEKILQEKQIQMENRYALSEAQIDPEEEMSNRELENCEAW